MGATVVGISADKPAVQRKFIEKFGLSFPIIPDTTKRIIGAYGATEVLGLTAKRQTFLIDPEGVLAYVWPKVKVEGHADDVLGVLRALAETAGVSA